MKILLVTLSLLCSLVVLASEIQSESWNAGVISYAQAVVLGEIIERRSVHPYLKIGSDEYKYQIKFLAKKVFKGSPQLDGKVLTFEAYLEPSEFYKYSQGSQWVIPFAEVSNNLNAVPLNYSLSYVLIDLNDLLKEISLGKIDFTKNEIKPIEEFFNLRVEDIYYSEEIILGYQVGQTILPRKGETLKDIPKAHFDKKPDHYIVDDFYVKRVLKGNKYFEGKVIHFIEYPWSDEQWWTQLRKIKHENPSPFTLGGLELLRLEEIYKISKSSDELYTGPYGYDSNITRIQKLRPSEEPVIKMYLRKAASPRFIPPAKRVWLDRPD